MTRFTAFMDEMADETEQDDEPRVSETWRSQLPANIIMGVAFALALVCWAMWR